MSQTNPLENQNKPVQADHLAIILVSAYVAAQMISQIASLKIGTVAGLAVDLGTFLYPVTFTLRDLVHKTIGKKGARTLVITAAAMNVAMVLYLMLADAVQPDPSWGLQTAFHDILAPVSQLVVASILAQVVSELLDTELYHRFSKRFPTKPQWMRVLVSNSVAVPIDNLLFAFIAFAGVLPIESIWQIFAVNLIVKYGVTLLSMPMIYLVPQGKQN